MARTHVNFGGWYYLYLVMKAVIFFDWQDLEKGPMTAREAVAYFARLYHLGRVKHMYFNIVKQQRYNPYELIAVSRQMVGTWILKTGNASSLSNF